MSASTNLNDQQLLQFILGGHDYRVNDEIYRLPTIFFGNSVAKQYFPNNYNTVEIAGIFKGRSTTNARMFEVHFNSLNPPQIHYYGM